MLTIVVLLVITLIVGLVIKGRYAKAISELDAQSAGLANADIEQTIHVLKGAHLGGESLKTLTRLEREYQQASEGPGADVEAILLELETANAQFRFAVVREQLQEAREKLATLSKKYAQVDAELQQLQAAQATNQRLLDELQATYQSARKDLLAKNFAYGSAMPAFEQELSELAEQFANVAKITAAGDHQAAASALKDLKQSVGTLADNVAAVPPLVTDLVKVFPEQLEEIQSSYDSLTKHNFHFPEVDIPAVIKQVHTQMDASDKALAAMDLKQAQSDNQAAADAIDSMYAAMEKEMTARRTVERDSDMVTEFIAHAQRQNHALMLELDHLNQSYTLNNGEIKEAKGLREELVTFDRQHQADLAAIDDHTAVFSVIAEHMDSATTRLKAIEERQVAINAAVSKLKEGEKSANTALKTQVTTMRTVQRSLDQLQLPGLPESYTDRLHHVQSEVDTIATALDQVKIDLDDINQQLVGLASDVSDLEDEGRAIVDAVGMTAQLLQAANRYRDEHPEVAEAARKSRALYNEYRYKEAADNLATALEEAVPGSYKRVEDAYLASQDNV
ncbi:Septation ring formation regulator ezrA [Lacticaseibacillus thailandensis DSM 22698 = JCM 13996]|uniref:Septation ring formation regulator ezrA n=1 Tax=Lacticaseibacillus thailandensis DSM 22698 = JCM 13996 TaxID=1423810 RepID=A0A0R2CJK5_9LACO|nr:Septation ring formation regulator ezrA [Lacticaseibacillus thailandensis DSM 22698 = JCM 13996]